MQILQLLYDHDVVEEDAFLQWAEEKAEADEGDRVFLTKAEPFLTWLREAEEADDSDQEED